MEKNNLYEIQGISKKRTDATDDTGFVKGQRVVGTLFFWPNLSAPPSNMDPMKKRGRE